MAAEQHVESENSEEIPKPKRQVSILDNFTKLTSGNEKVRIKSGVELLKYLTENEHVEKADTEVKYVLGRLIRGLGSSKQHTKIGFFTTLIGLFNLKNVSVHEVLEYVAKELHKTGSSKSEDADVCLGRILVAGAIFRSTLYENCSDEEKTAVLKLLFAAGKERAYLNLASHKLMIALYDKIDCREFEKLIFPLIKMELAKSWQEQDLDSLYLLIETSNRYPQLFKKKFLKSNLSTSEIICVESLPYLCNTLLTVPGFVALKHPIFELLVKTICASQLLVPLFEELDRTLMKPNRNKHFIVTKLLIGVLENLKEPSLIPDLFNKNHLQQVIDKCRLSVGKLRDKEFEVIMKKLFQVLLDSLKKDLVKDNVKVKVLKKLLFHPGTFIFEKVTRSKLVQNIISTLKMEGVKMMATLYRDVIVNTDESAIQDKRRLNMDRVYASRLLVKLLNHPAVHEELDWKIDHIIFFMRLALLKEDESQYNDTAESFKETFYSSLNLKLGKLNDVRTLLSKLNGILQVENAKLRNPLTNDDYETWQRCTVLSKKLETKTGKRNIVFHILFLHLSLQLFNNTMLASESLKELFSCYEKVKKKDENVDDPLWIEVVVDLFLNLLSHNSHLLRNMINCVFPHLCKYMNATAIHQILAVLDPKNEANPLSKFNEDSDEDIGDETSNDEESSDSGGEVEEEDDDGEEDADDEEESSNDKLRLALGQVLGAGSDVESVDLDTLDEYEGDKLDAALGQAFKQFRPNLGKKKTQNKDDETLTHFRIRVLDLVEIYLSSNPSMLLTLEIMVPLLQTLEFCIRDDHQKPLKDRVSACLKKLTSMKKFSDFEDVSESLLAELLTSFLAKGTKTAIIVQEMGEKIAECCTFVVHCSQVVRSNQVKKKKNKITVIVKGSLEDFFTKRDCLVPYVLFKSLMQLNWDGVAKLVPMLTNFLFEGTIRPFRQTQALELLKVFYNNHRFVAAHPDKVPQLEEVTVTFLQMCLSFFNDFNNSASEKKVKEKFVCSIFELLASVKCSSFAVNFEEWSVLGEAIRDCRSQLTFSTDTKVAFGKLCNKLNISKVVQMKSNVIKLSKLEDDDSQMRSKQDKQKKKRKWNKEQLKLKKQSKHLRLNTLSEGLNKRSIDWDDTEAYKKIKTA